MTSAQFEAFLAHLYCDPQFAREFLEAPERIVANAGLSAMEQAAALQIDRVGLSMAVESYSAKRRRPKRRRLWSW